MQSRQIGTGRDGASRAVLVSVLIAGVLVGVGAALLAAWIAPDIIPSLIHAPRDTTLWEDGSYAVSLGEFSLTGCVPLHPWNGEIVTGWCLDGGESWLGHFRRGTFVPTIGIDSPWEDFLPAPLGRIAYALVDLIFK